MHQWIPTLYRSMQTNSKDDIETTTTTTRGDSSNHPHPRIAYVTFSHLNVTDLDRWTNVIFPATELFVPATDPYYVVMTMAMQEIYHNLTRTRADFQKYRDRIQPIFVDCPEGRFGHSPCCKQELGLLEFYQRYYYDDDHRTSFSSEHDEGILRNTMTTNTTTPTTRRRSSRQTNYDWILFQDDDMYIRHRELQIFVHDLPLDEEPIVLTSHYPPGPYLGQEGYLKHNARYHCSRLDNWTYPWGQPAVYNRAAFEQVVPIIFQRGGLVKQCLEYHVTHDVGNALLHWMMMFPTLWIRITANKVFRSDFLGYHRVGRDGPRSEIRRVHYLFDQKPYPFNVSTPIPRFWTNSTGFRLTRTFQQYGHPSNWTEWHTMPTSDCLLDSTQR